MQPAVNSGAAAGGGSNASNRAARRARHADSQNKLPCQTQTQKLELKRTCATWVLTASGISRCSSTAPADDMAAWAASLSAQDAVLAPPCRIMRLSPVCLRAKEQGWEQ